MEKDRERIRAVDVLSDIETGRCSSKKEHSLVFVSIHQISGWQFSLVLIVYRNSEYPWIFTVLGQDSASRFATVSKDEILAINEAAAPTNTKKEKKSGLSVFTGQ